VDKGSLAGVTTANYTSVLDWKTAELGNKTILLKNTDINQSLKYKLLGYAVEGGNAKELVPKPSWRREKPQNFITNDNGTNWS